MIYFQVWLEQKKVKHMLMDLRGYEMTPLLLIRGILCMYADT